LRVAKDFPEALKTTRFEYVYSMVGRADLLEDDGVRHFQLLEALHAGGYVSENPFMPEELIWFELFEAYVAKGETQKATALAKGFEYPGS
ncbi:hypothetical protein ACTHSL_13670, partial [Neisseria sp. P0008.S010]|uniref:hypothetical protein n=1 Tax=Neisseria sp. P0008.S010 TaxID=3436707 RepID=UPI003F806856